MKRFLMLTIVAGLLAGVSYVAAQVNVPDKGLTLQVHNYDYEPND